MSTYSNLFPDAGAVRSAGDTMTGSLNVPGGAVGTQVPQAVAVQPIDAHLTGISQIGAIPIGSLMASDGSVFRQLPVGSDGQRLVADSGQSTGFSYLDDVAPISDATGITGANVVQNLVSISQINYDAIVTPDPATLYFITG